MPQRMGKLFIAHRIRRHHIERAAQVVIQQPENAVHHIVDVDPGQVLTPATHRPAEPQAKQRHDFPQHAAFRGKDRAGTQQTNPGFIALRLACDLLPFRAQLMGELVMRRLILGDHHLAKIAVIARRRAGNQHRRRVITGFNQRDEALGYLPAALAQPLFLRRRPAFVCDGFAGKVDHGVEGVKILCVGQAFPDVDALVEPRARFVRIARHHRHVVPKRKQAWNQMAANQARAAGNQNIHATSRLRLALPAHRHGDGVGIA